MNTLTSETAERWAIDPTAVRQHARQIRAATDLAQKVRDVHRPPDLPSETDPDLMLYSGGFFPEADRRAMARLHALQPQELAGTHPAFQDPRLSEMLFRYRARNWPATLDEAEREAWDAYRRKRLTEPQGGGSITLDVFHERLLALRERNADDPARLDLLDQLEEWAQRVSDR
jgi:exodeoxyribonuclease-1